MRKASAAAQTNLAPPERAREGRLFCPVAGCGKGYFDWMMTCVSKTCPKIVELVERSELPK